MVPDEITRGVPRAADSGPDTTEVAVARHSRAGHEGITRRLDELDREAEEARRLEARTRSDGAVAGLAVGAALGALLGPRLWLLPAAGLAALLLRAARGRRPPGLREAAGAEERYALKALRGDFRSLPRLVTPEERAEVSRFEADGGRAPGPGEADPHDVQDEAAVAGAVRAARR